MTISILGYCFLAVNCLLWPVRSFLTLRKHPIGQPITTPKRKRYAVGLNLTLFQTGFALWAALDNHIPLFGSWHIGLSGMLATVIFLAVTIGSLLWLVEHRSVAWRMRFYSILPTTGDERTAWVLICVIVAVGEEIVYRAVMFQLVYSLTGNYWTAAAISAAVFALNHLVQGWISAGTIFIFGLGFHLLVRITGGLYAAIAAHFVYDLFAGIVFGRAAQKELEDDQAVSVAVSG